MYESPIHLYMTDFQTQLIKQQEEQILKAVQSVAVGVDHDELFRALRFDREQYQKGYHDAIMDKDMVEVVRCKDCINAEKLCGVLCCAMAHDVVRQKNDFCSYGEREDNG